MRAIEKGKPPEALRAHVAAATPDWRPTYENFREKPALRAALAIEQLGLCAYCMGRIGKAGREDCHVEHLRPQHPFTELQLSYDNMLGSCQGRRPTEARIAPEHCGAARGNWFDANLFVSPLDKACEHYFQFRETGDIEAATDERPVRSGSEVSRARAAEETIERLKLNALVLKQHRKGAIDDELDDLGDSVTKADIQERLARLRTPGRDGFLTVYCIAIVQALERELAAARA